MSATKPYTPSPVIEFAFVSRTTVPAISDWVDVTTDCFEAKTTRGRSSEFDQFNAGTLTLKLDNDDRKFDPLYDSSVSASLPNGEALVKLMAEFDDAATLYSDTFASAIASFWETRKGTTSISSGKLTGNGFAVFTPMFDGSRSIVTVEIPQKAASTGQTYLALVSEGTTAASTGTAYAWFKISNTTFEARTHTPALATATSPITYDPLVHRWFQIELTGTSIVFRTSVDGNTWTTRLTVSDATTIGSFPTQVRASLEEVYVSGNHAQFDNFSVTSTRLPVWYGVVEGFRIGYEEGGRGSYVDVNAVDHIDYLSDYVFPNTLQTWVAANLSGAKAVDDWFPFDKITHTGKGFEEERLPNVGDAGQRYMQERVKVEIGDPIHASSLGALKIPAFTSSETDRFHAAYRAFPGAEFTNYTNTVTYGAWVQFEEAGSFQDVGSGSFFDVLLMGDGPPDFGVSYGLRVQATFGAPGAVAWSSGSVFIEVDALHDVGGGVVEPDGPTVFDGKPHHILFSRNTTSGFLYWDGELIKAKGVAGASGHGDAGYEAVGVCPPAVPGFTSQTPVYRVSDVMIWQNYNISDSEVRALYERMRDGWIGEVLTGAAINALLDEMDWPLDFRLIDEGSVLVQLPKELEGRNVLKLMQQVAASEGGRLFIDELGRVVFHDRQRQFTNALEAVGQYVFSDIDRDTSPIDVGIVDESLNLVLDDEFKITRAEVERVGGSVQIAETADGRFTREIKDLLFTEDVLALSMAEWLVFRYATSQVRADAWSVTPEVFTDDWTTVLGLQIGTKVGMQFTPNGLGDPITLELILGMVSHQIDDEEWIIKFHGTPADDSAYALWGDGNVGWNEGVWA